MLDKGVISLSLIFKFKASNNEAEYEVVAASLRIIVHLKAQWDSLS